MSKHLWLSVALLAATPALSQETATEAPEAAAPAPAAPAFTTPADVSAGTVVATVGGTEITLGHMIVLRNSLPEQYLTLPDDVLYKGILDQLVQQEALVQSLGDPARADALRLDNDRRGYLSNVVLQGVVQAAVTDAALQAAYDAKYANAAPATEYNAAHILVATKEEADAIRTELDAGADFATLAQERSTDGAAANGGDLGWFGVGMMVKPFEDAVVAMQPGTIAGPVQTDFGWHLIQLKETREAAKPTLDEVREELAAEIEQKVIADHVAALEAAATISRPGDGFDPAIIKDSGLLEE
jgi:peptidyl-prolyl cis-trans isomerase C